jgi:hypothetical protein
MATIQYACRTAPPLRSRAQPDPGQFPRTGSTSAPPIAIDRNAGRPPRQVQWSFGVQREIFKNLAVEASYIGNRGAWWEANGLINVNAMSPEYLLKKGIDINNATDRALLTKPITNADVIARGFKAPYAGFPTTATLAQALRPFPQFAAAASSTPAINYLWAPLGHTWYDSLQIKVTKRYSYGLDLSCGFTRQKELAMGNENIGATTTLEAVNNVFDRQTNKYISGLSRPYTFFIAANYACSSESCLPAYPGSRFLSFSLVPGSTLYSLL